MPWNEKLWDTPNVAHDNPRDQRFHASLLLGFADPAAPGKHGEALSPGLRDTRTPLAAVEE